MVEVPKLDQITDTSIATDWLKVKKEHKQLKIHLTAMHRGQHFDGYTELVPI